MPLERDGGLLEGRWGRLFVGPPRLFGPMAFLCLGLRPRGVCFTVLRVLIVHILLSIEKGVFPRY
jgi:hypothetical protein